MSKPQPIAQPKRRAPQAERAETVGDFILWDDVFPALGLRNRFGRESWIVQTRIRGSSVRRSLGAVTKLTRSAARQAAAALIAALAEERAAVTCPETTLGSFLLRWLTDCAGQWKPATYGAHASGALTHILPPLGARPVAALTVREVADWYAALPGSSGSKTRHLAVLSGMMRHAELIGLRAPGTNPCAGMRRKVSGFTATVLRAKDYARLGQALEARAASAPMRVAFIRFLTLTGCRRGEALELRWDWIDGNRAALPDAKAGPRAIWLGTPALELLAALPRTGDLVFGADDKPLSLATLQSLWHEIRAEIGLGTLRLHDLRHSFATAAVSAGEPLRTVAGLLGHSDLAITEGYSHLADDTLRKAAAGVGSYLNATLSGKGRPSNGFPRPKAPQKPTAPARLPEPQGGIPRAALQGFAKSRLSLPAYCAAAGLDLVAFRRALAAENKRSGRRAGK